MAGLSLKRMVSLTTWCIFWSNGGNPSHTYRRAISRIATTGSAQSKKSNDKPSKEKTPPPCAFALCPEFSGIYPFSKLPVPDSYPCPAHDNTLSRVVSILNQ
ncbi:TPA: hypothetical protein JLB99_001656 [Escherichia coli]|nr:hypothetical protein [Escherichia coli]